MTIAADTPPLLRDADADVGAGVGAGVSADALVRALCHDMRTPLVSLQAVLHQLDRPGDPGDPDAGALHGELVELARAQTEHLVSMLRTAVATGGAVAASGWPRSLADIVRLSLASCGLPPGQARVSWGPGAGEVAVADARVQRVLVNLLENAHRHGGGRPVGLTVTARPGWVDLALTQDGVPDRVAGHLAAEEPPSDLTGLGLWSVRRQTTELGGRVSCRRDGEAFTVVVTLPDR